MTLPHDLVCTPEEFLAAPPAERVKLVLAQIDARPEWWDQSVWMLPTECGTTACVAGWACLLAGAEPPEGVAVSVDFVLHQGAPQRVDQLGAELLGLDEDQSAALFWDDNTRGDLDAVLAGDLTHPWRDA